MEEMNNIYVEENQVMVNEPVDAQYEVCAEESGNPVAACIVGATAVSAIGFGAYAIKKWAVPFGKKLWAEHKAVKQFKKEYRAHLMTEPAESEPDLVEPQASSSDEIAPEAE